VVRIDPPPPSPRRLLRPVHRTLPSGTDLFRIYDPLARHGPRDARQFRYVGPFARFDHHRGTGRRERRGIEPAVALYERGRTALELPRGQDAPLTDPDVLTEIRRIGLAHSLLVLLPS
jgi:hypothetical protein